MKHRKNLQAMSHNYKMLKFRFNTGLDSGQKGNKVIYFKCKSRLRSISL